MVKKFVAITSVIGVFLANWRLQTETESLPWVILVGLITSIAVLLMRFVIEPNWLIATGYAILWALIYTCSCLFPCVGVLLKADDLGISASIALLLLILLSSISIMLWESLPPDDFDTEIGDE